LSPKPTGEEFAATVKSMEDGIEALENKFKEENEKFSEMDQQDAHN